MSTIIDLLKKYKICYQDLNDYYLALDPVKNAREIQFLSSIFITDDDKNKEEAKINIDLFRNLAGEDGLLTYDELPVVRMTDIAYDEKTLRNFVKKGLKSPLVNYGEIAQRTFNTVNDNNDKYVDDIEFKHLEKLVGSGSLFVRNLQETLKQNGKLNISDIRKSAIASSKFAQTSMGAIYAKEVLRIEDMELESKTMINEEMHLQQIRAKISQDTSVPENKIDFGKIPIDVLEYYSDYVNGTDYFWPSSPDEPNFGYSKNQYDAACVKIFAARAFSREPEKYVEKIEELKAGNCGENAFLAKYYLSKKGIKINKCSPTFQGKDVDHAFVVANVKSDAKEFNFKDINEDAVIVDTWGNFFGYVGDPATSNAEDYADEALSKLLSFEADNKFLIDVE